MIDWRARAPQRAQTPAREPFNAPLFRSLIEGMDPERRYVVLDLGAARTQTITLFSGYRCRLDIADLGESAAAFAACDEEDGPEPDAVAEALLPSRHDEPVDIVLCWDLLNYLAPRDLQAVMTRVAARSRPGMLAHALIVYAETHMPERPGGFVPTAELALNDLDPRPASREAPRYSPDDLRRALPGFGVERAMLLGNGMQEFLFRLDV